MRHINEIIILCRQVDLYTFKPRMANYLLTIEFSAIHIFKSAYIPTNRKSSLLFFFYVFYLPKYQIYHIFHHYYLDTIRLQFIQMGGTLFTILTTHKINKKSITIGINNVVYTPYIHNTIERRQLVTGN